MGLFSSEKKTYVSSTLYNLSGDPKGKPSFKRTAVASAVVRGYNIPLDLRNAYLSGYAMTTRSFARWAESSGYNSAIGMTKSQIALQSSFSTEPVREYLQTLANPGERIEIITAEGGPAEHSMWADRYMIEHYLPANADGLQDGVEYDYSVDSVTGSLKVSVGPTPAKGEADTRPQYIVPVTDFDVNGQYVYAVYRGNTSGDATRNVLGDWRTIDGIVASEPDLTGWVLATGSQNVSTNVELLTTVTTVTKFANGDITTTIPAVTSRNESIAVTKDTWTREVYVGGSKTDTLDLEKELQTIERDYSFIITEESTVTVTTYTSSTFMGNNGVRTTTTVRQVLVPMKRYRQSVNTVTTQRYGPVKMFIYKIGSGVPKLDSLVQQSVAHIDWLPFIPVRIDNKFLEERDKNLFALTNKAFKKMFGRRVKLQSVIDSLKENKSLDEIDFAHIAFGVPLNTKSQWGLQYIYKFLEGLSAASGQSKATFDNYNRAYKAYATYIKESQEWYESQNTEWGARKPRPVMVSMPVRPKGAISFKSARSNLHFHQVLEYEFIYEERGTGRLMVKGKPAPVGHFWWTDLREVDEDVALEDARKKAGASGSFLRRLRRRSATIVLNWQDTSRTWKRMVLRGALHTNYAYKDYSVKTYPSDAMSDEDESGFFFPLNAAIFKSMGIVNGTEMSNCSAYLILNSYKVVKKKWYQTGFFAVIVAIVVIVVSVLYPPTGGVAGGVLGANGVVGAAITGLAATSTIALIVGAVANAIAGAILGAILTRVATKVFGNTIFGQIFAMVAVMMIGNYQAAASNGSSPLSFSESFGSMMRAENLMKLSMNAVKGYSEYINKSTMNILAEAKELQEAYSAETRRIHEMYVEQFGAGKVIDPMAFTSAGQGQVEGVDTFLSRTLMTGMDIAETTHNMLSEFASLTLTLDTKV